MTVAPEPGSHSNFAVETEFAGVAADQARAIARRYYRQWNGLEFKGDRSPVTLADQAIEDLIRSSINERFPGDGVFGEETGVTGGDRERLWIIDPIDGTGSFATGNPLFGFLLGFFKSGRPVLGVLDACVTGERWVALRDHGATMNGEPCRTSARRKLSDAAISCTAVHSYGPEDFVSFQSVSERAALTRLGGDCYAFGLVALGHLDAVVETGLKPYDYLPLVPIVEEAGGVFTDWHGKPLTTESEGKVVAAATAELHAEILASL